MNDEGRNELYQKLIIIIFLIGLLYNLFTGSIKIGGDSEEFVDEPAMRQVQECEKDESTCSPFEMDEDITVS